MIYNIALAGFQTDTTVNSTSLFVLAICYYTTLCPTMPRFIISVRELYDRDLRGRWQGIDTGFGMSSHVSSGNATRTMSAIEFADVAPGQVSGQVAEGELDESEAIRLEMLLGDSTRQV
jgi:hypothetical protein